MCANCSQHVLPTSAGKLARACKECWEKVNPQVDYRMELEAANMKMKELAGLLAAEKQGREYDRVLFRTEADSHRISVRKLEKDGQTALEEVKTTKEAEISELQAQIKAGKVKKKTVKRELKSALQTISDHQKEISEQKTALREFEEERKAFEMLREKSLEMQKQLESVKEYHQMEVKLLKDDYEETIARLKSDLQSTTDALKIEKQEKTQLKKVSEDQKTTLQKTAAELSVLTGEHTKLLSKLKQFQDSENSLLLTIDTLKADKSFSEKETELLNTSLQLKSVSTRASELEADNADLRQRIVPELQQQITVLTTELSEAKASAENEEREKGRMHLQLQETMKRADEVRRELSKKTHAEMKAVMGVEGQQAEACISCVLM